MKRKLKKVVFLLIMIGLTLTSCFLVIEFVLGYLYYSNVSEISDKEFDPLLGWRLRPGTYWIKAANNFTKHRVRINEVGVRFTGSMGAAEKPNLRLIVLGDSFTFAEQVADEEMFTSHLELILNQTSAKDFQVINTGVPGYGTAQELLLLRRLAGETNNIAGDVYLLMAFTNDILDNLRLSYGSLKISSIKPGFVLNHEGGVELKYLPENGADSDSLFPVQRGEFGFRSTQVFKAKIATALQTKPDLIKYLNEVGFGLKMPRMPGLLNGWYREDILNEGVPLLRGLLKEMKREVELREGRLLVSLIPSPIQIYSETYGRILRNTFPSGPGNQLVYDFLNDRVRPQRVFREICDELEIPFFDLYPVLSTSNDQELYIPADGHFTAIAHSIVSESLGRFILEYGLTERVSH